jgi:hypothetical protein
MFGPAPHGVGSASLVDASSSVFAIATVSENEKTPLSGAYQVAVEDSNLQSWD